MRIIVLFSLKAGTSHDEYRKWACERDMPSVRALPSIRGFDVLRATSTLAGDTPPYQYIEIIDIADMDRFQQDVASDIMRSIAAEFSAIADATFILTAPVE